MCDKQNLRSACAFAQSDQSLCVSLEYSTTVKLLIEQYFEVLCLKGGCTGSSESTPVKIPHCLNSNIYMYESAHGELVLLVLLSSEYQSEHVQNRGLTGSSAARTHNECL